MVSQEGMLKEGDSWSWLPLGSEKALVHGLDRETRGWLAGLGQWIAENVIGWTRPLAYYIRNVYINDYLRVSVVVPSYRLCWDTNQLRPIKNNNASHVFIL